MWEDYDWLADVTLNVVKLRYEQLYYMLSDLLTRWQ